MPKKASKTLSAPDLGPFIYTERKPKKGEQNDEGEVYGWTADGYMLMSVKKLKKWSIWAPVLKPKVPTKAMVKKTEKMLELEDG